MNETQAAEIVQRGHEFLTKDQGKDWFRFLDRERFDINDVFDCIGGQLYGSYCEMHDKLPDPPCETSKGAYYGFDVEYWHDGPALQKAWDDLLDRLSA